jgi:hypothetical protein
LFPLFECARSEKVWSSSIWALLDFLFSLILYRRKPDLLEVLISCSRLKALIFVLHFSHRALRSVGNSPGSGLGLSLGWALPLLPISRQESPSPRAWQSSILVPARARRPVLECRHRTEPVVLPAAPGLVVPCPRFSFSFPAAPSQDVRSLLQFSSSVRALVVSACSSVHLVLRRRCDLFLPPFVSLTCLVCVWVFTGEVI